MLKSASLTIDNFTFEWGSRTYVMGILNITPDSFSGDGLVRESALSSEAVERALEQASQFLQAGADIIDIGGESTRPGAQPVDAEAEIRRVIPVVRALSAEFEAPISIDTYKSEVAEAALEAGAHIVNDVWGFKVDPRLAAVCAHSGAPCILMHNRSSWANAQIKESLGGRYVGVPYDNLIEDIRRELLESVEIARQASIPDNRILLDPGIGFGKTVEQNLELLDRLDEIRSLGYPLLLGVSRKSFIGYTLDLPPERRVSGTAAAVAIGIDRGADIVRVHDVEEMLHVARMTDAIVRRPRQA